MQYLIEKQNIDIDIKGRDATPIHYAFENCNITIIEYLITKGANIKAVDTYHGWTHYIVLLILIELIL